MVIMLFQDGLVCLSEPSSKRELSHIVDVWMSTADLVKVTAWHAWSSNDFNVVNEISYPSVELVQRYGLQSNQSQFWHLQVSN